MIAARENSAMRGELRYDEPLARHTTWRVGGPAKRYYRPADLDDLATYLRTIEPEEPLLWLGLGSNLLVRDGGFPGTVLALQGCLDQLEQEPTGELRVEAGVSCAKVARFAARAGLCGAEFLAGIPGTMGGALAMNAGAFGGETWTIVDRVLTLDRSGELRERRPKDFTIGYRKVTGVSGEWFTVAWLKLSEGDVEKGQSEIRRLLDRRSATQPIGLPSCGSVFRNPPQDHAARLIEAAGLKGLSIGGAEVSEQHANFIINTGEATAADIEALIGAVQREVEKTSGILLQPEVHIVGIAEASDEI